MTPTVFLVDDDPSVRAGMTRLLRAAGFMVEVFTSGEDFLARPPYDRDGCLILDLRMPGLSGADVQQRLRAHANNLPVIFLSGHGAVPDSVRAMKEGAVDFLTKPVDEDVLLAAIGAALARQRVERARDDELAQLRARLTTLTPREADVLACVISGALNKQIAGHLDITEATVKVHRARVMEKMGAGSVADLVRVCDALGVAPRPCA
jgi:FixJ family two-component response regulator